MDVSLVLESLREGMKQSVASSERVTWSSAFKVEGNFTER
jgi:hypothetical protein